MSIQKFTAFEREALWLAHNKKCAYTREPLDMSSFHIDHILPESLASNITELEKVKSLLKLDEKFDIYGYENLLPCRSGANLQKGATVFDEARTQFFLGIAASRKAEVLKNLEKINKRNISGKALILLQQCLEGGQLSPSEVTNILDEHKEQPDEIFHLIESLKFFDTAEIRTVSKADIDELLDRQVRLGQNNHIVGVTLTKDKNETLYVKTCKEYHEAIESGYYALTNFDIKMSSFFEHQYGLLSSLKAATVPERSFIDDPRSGIVDIALIPFSLFPWVGDAPEIEDTSATYQSKVDDGTISIKRIKQNMLCVEEHEGMGQQLIEVARADFNGDGLEEILLFEYCYATHGTLGYGGIRILGRNTVDGLFEIIQ
ncbi:hypothetical protein HPY09_20005 (plasmid) [Vibrio cholerae]|uniref:hypothetical protein n=1 Tax=Vibrio cholerae TaxID=666 RepID=UPI00159A2B7F|nr:hypothetical protein [Vibrio cholerae]EGR3850427.1 hypothetical protein [Vibrio cholerae]EGR5588279.1 hypothetical protein [Vibrio cholerae]MDV2358344.1 hypothetical protein [Vibrio cholerae]MVC22293.1 hypothetical protein [Vibrio cholerae]NOE60306.1 hypothetical protein [Vibrio cholerae]